MSEALAIIQTQQGMIESLRTEVAELRGELEPLRVENRELRARLKQDSSNSSQPPSTDPPWKPSMGRPGRGRKPGGQPGHKGSKRELVAPDDVVVVKPQSCARCGAGLTGEDHEPFRHQVTEIPEVRARVTEYRLHTLRCACCDGLTSPQWPQGVPRGAFGPRLQAILAVCAGAYHVSKRNIEQLALDFFGVKISLGAISELEEQTCAALEASTEQAASYIAAQSTAHADETGWFQRNRRAWLWVVATSSMARFLVHPRRAAAVAKELLKDFVGVLVSDQYSGYSFIAGNRRQLCWAHLIRHFQSFCDYGRREKSLSIKLVGAARKLFRLWHRLRDGTITREQFQTQITPLRAAIPRLLNEGRYMPSRKVAKSCRWILRDQESLWTFVDVAGVEPTNNHAERVIRPAVLWRKGCFGTQSERGSRFVERILTVVTSLRLQNRNVLDFVTAACRAPLLAQQAPSLLPP